MAEACIPGHLLFATWNDIHFGITVLFCKRVDRNKNDLQCHKSRRFQAPDCRIQTPDYTFYGNDGNAGDNASLNVCA